MDGWFNILLGAAIAVGLWYFASPEYSWEMQ